MSKFRVSEKNLELNKQDGISNKKFSHLVEKYNQLKKENQNLLEESKILKDLIIQNAKKNYQLSIIEADNLNNSHKNSKFKNIFYFQIIIGIIVIILSLGFHILYLAITDCLLYNGGDPGCWIKNWMGIDINGSFFLDIMLYTLIMLQVLLIMLIIRNHLVMK
ncbi:MAG: hypothetical protein ACFFBC_07490 [Promethearchaeota archaeon]